MAADRSRKAGAAEPSSSKVRVPHTFTTVQIKRAFESVADQIRTQLMTGALRPGDRLPSERELAEQFSLSRNTVREGLRALEVTGLLELRKGASGGAFVRQGQGDIVISGFTDLFWLGTIESQHLTEGRLIVGVAVTRLACRRATDADFELLKENVAAAEEAIARGNYTERVRLNLEFHRILARAAQNPVLTVLTDALIEIQAQLLKTFVPAPEAEVMASRWRLLKQLLLRKEVAAAKEMEQHLRTLQQHYLTEDSRVRTAAGAA